MREAVMPANPARRWAVWLIFALVLVGLPRVFDSNLSITMLSQMGIAIIACLSYNILFGQGGMVSFGHAVYTGLGSYLAIHALNAVSDGAFPLPVSLIPIVGGLGGLFFALLFGYVTTRKAGTPFAMITLGMAELVFAVSLMFSGFFGGEAGISGNRVVGEPFLGVSYGPARQVYYLIAVYTLACVALMFAFTRTPLGRLLNAVRDNPERVAFTGHDPQTVRYLAFMVAGFFAGTAGGLAALHFEIVTAEVVGAVRSGSYLLFTFLGGSTVFFGPIIGGVLMVLAFVLFSELTRAWLLYLGLIFLFMVMYAPGGLASLITMNARVAAFGRLRELLPSYLGLFVTGMVMLLGLSALIEMGYHWQLNAALGDSVTYLGLALDTRSVGSWLGAGLLAAAGFGAFEWVRRRFVGQWAQVQADIDRQIQQQERG